MAEQAAHQSDGPISEALVDKRSLQRRLAGVSCLRDALPIRSIERIGQGQSNLTFRVRLAEGTVILRRPPVGPLPPRAHDVLREHRVMSALAQGPTPVPRVLHACADASVIGVPFFLMEDLPGDAIRFTLPPALVGTEGA